MILGVGVDLLNINRIETVFNKFSTRFVNRILADEELELYKNLQKELNRAIQENLTAKYNLESIKENKKLVESNLNSLQSTYNQLAADKERLNNELLAAKLGAMFTGIIWSAPSTVILTALMQKSIASVSRLVILPPDALRIL